MTSKLIAIALLALVLMGNSSPNTCSNLGNYRSVVVYGEDVASRTGSDIVQILRYTENEDGRIVSVDWQSSRLVEHVIWKVDRPENLVKHFFTYWTFRDNRVKIETYVPPKYVDSVSSGQGVGVQYLEFCLIEVGGIR